MSFDRPRFASLLRHAARRLALGLAFLLAHGPEGAGQEPEPVLESMSLEELLAIPVVAASNALEPLTEAPATVLVITRQDIRARGYTELSEILDDLPGMEVIRPYGATYLKSYWRGFRNTIGDPFLVLLDGLVLNHLYFNTADVLVTLPLSNVDRVEVVYGPASSIYGANAFMGVISVFTTRPRESGGGSAEGRVGVGTSGTRTADVTASYARDDWSIRLTGRFDDGELDSSHRGLYEYTKDRYYADRRLWGGFVDNPALAGSFLSERHHRSADLRLTLGPIEAGLLYQRLASGYGVEYPGDRSQNNAVWARPDVTAFLRLRKELSPVLLSSTLLRYRTSDVSNDSYFLESFPGTDDSGESAQLVRLSYWQALNSSWSLNQDFEAHFGRSRAALEGRGEKPGKRPTARFGLMGLSFGFRLELKDLQKAYDISAGPDLPASEVDASRYPYPDPPTDAVLGQNRIRTSDAGVYAQAKVLVAGPHQLNLGLRYDHNSHYGGAATFRAGYVGDFGRWGVKALYGEAFQEPNPRLLYGGWTGSGSDPSLDPERSRTVELAATYRTAALSGLASLFWVRNRDTIVNDTGGARNIADRSVVGVDLHAQALVKASAAVRLRGWAYVSFLLDDSESDGVGGSHPIGDLAPFKVMGGVTADLPGRLTATLRGRYIGRRTTVLSNPVGEVSGFATLDAAVNAVDLPVAGLGLSLTVTNLLDRAYAHPGVREADAGTTPGSFDAAGRWTGSAGFYSSLLPQPGRCATLSFLFRY